MRGESNALSALFLENVYLVLDQSESAYLLLLIKASLTVHKKVL